MTRFVNRNRLAVLLVLLALPAAGLTLADPPTPPPVTASVTFGQRKYVHRGAKNFVGVQQASPVSGTHLKVAACSTGLSAAFVDGPANATVTDYFTWNATSSTLLSVTAAPDAPLGTGTVTVAQTDNGGKPISSYTLTVTVCASPFAAAPQPAPVDAKASWAKWQANMGLGGAYHQILVGALTSFDSSEAGPWYYDGVDSALKMGRQDVAVAIADGYLSQIIAPKNGAVPGYYVFGRGLVSLYKATGKQAYLDAAVTLAEKAAYNRHTPYSAAATPDSIRETAYNLDLELALAGVPGQAPQADRIAALADLGLGQLDQLTNKGWAHQKPFMVGLLGRALIAYDATTPDARVKPYLASACDVMWAEGFDQPSGSLKYEWNSPGVAVGVLPTQPPSGTFPGSPDTRPAPDLNLLVAPVYAWCGQADRADVLFAAGVKGAYVADGKHANQQVYVADQFAAWRGW